MEVFITLVVLGVIIYFAVKKFNIMNKEKEIGSLNSQIAKQKDELARVREELREVLLLKDKTDELRAEILNSEEELEELESDIQNKEDESRNLSERIDDVKSSMSLYLETGYLLDAGFYEEPKYLYETSDRYKTKIQLIRAEIKNMISENRAIIIPDSIVAIDDSALSKKVLQGQAKLMLKTFNIEVDLLLLNLKTSNFAKTVERIEKIATEVEKCVVSLKCGFNEEYVRLRLKECELQYQFKLKQQEEQEEQRAIKEQMAEEQKAIRDFERAIAKAKKDEQMYEDALDIAKKELQVASDAERDKLMLKIEKLEAQLKEAIESESRAKSMAEQTKRGYVYVISNIGSFGEDVYKIGMTRRLEPLDRVKELGDASVPFFFDVHAMIFSDDAPRLEKELHKVFNHKRVNMINEKREFFNITLGEIEKVVKENHVEIEFTQIAQAKEYRETLAIKQSMLNSDYAS